jgi:hypothetical protein
MLRVDISEPSVRCFFMCGASRKNNWCKIAEAFMQVNGFVQGRERSVGIATSYRLDGPGIESWWRRHFPHPSRPALCPTQPPIQWVPCISRGQSGRGVALNTHFPSSAEVRERVELYLYSPHRRAIVACSRGNFTFTFT